MQEGRVYAVPAEEQWEWACRAGTTNRWFFGDSAALMKDFAWTTPWSEAKRRPVGGLAPNPFGLYDIYVNVQELTMDHREQAVFRGGQTGESPQRARSAARVAVGTHYEPAIVLGFRVVIVGDLIFRSGRWEWFDEDGISRLFLFAQRICYPPSIRREDCRRRP